jgi:BolA family transcriptional regulator, general stress-responsive regulator
MRPKFLRSRIDEADMGQVAQAMEAKLQAAFSPERLEVVDDSAKHAGHAGAREGGESHFTVKITSSRFEGLGRLARQRQVYAALKEELDGRVHALSVQASAPGDA